MPSFLESLNTKAWGKDLLFNYLRPYTYELSCNNSARKTNISHRFGCLLNFMFSLEKPLKRRYFTSQSVLNIYGIKRLACGHGSWFPDCLGFRSESICWQGPCFIQFCDPCVRSTSPPYPYETIEFLG